MPVEKTFLEEIRDTFPACYNEILEPTNPTKCPSIADHGIIVYCPDDFKSFIAYCICAPINHTMRVVLTLMKQEDSRKKYAQSLPWKTEMHEHPLNPHDPLCNCDVE